MKGVSIVLCFLLCLVFMSGCKSQPRSYAGASADWAYNFVVWNDDIYEILKEEIGADKIDEKIGEIKQYSDVEGTYSNGFSNKYPVGTKLYSIKDVKVSDYIAIQTAEGLYIKAKDNGKYGGKD